MYHWVGVGEAAITHQFSHIEVGGERAVGCTAEDFRMVFGLGPAHPDTTPETRCRKLLTALETDLVGLRWGRQVHGNGVVVIDSAPEGALTGVAGVGSCDALVTDRPGVGLVVWSADCVPVLLAGPGVVAAIHSGWRGSAADIVGVVVRRLELSFGVTADQLVAALGPAISGAHYEVGPEVVEALESVGSGTVDWRRGDHVDLRLFLAGRLCRLGVPRESIGIVGPCTYSTPGLASFRRDGDAAGRQLSVVSLRG